MFSNVVISLTTHLSNFDYKTQYLSTKNSYVPIYLQLIQINILLQ